jgi:hypothetical protein
MTLIEKKAFNQFRKKVKEKHFISIDELWLLKNRYTQGWMGRRFLNPSLKQKYYKFWIKRLEDEGTIKETSGVGIWEVCQDDDDY